MIRTTISGIVFFLLFLSLSACKPHHKDSIGITTGDIFMIAEIQSSQGISHIEVNLSQKRSTGDPVELSEGEYISVSFLNNTIRLSQVNNFLEIDYEGNIENFNSAGTYTISLHRQDGTIIESQAEMEAPFEIQTPEEGDIFTDQDLVNILWTSAIPKDDLFIRTRLGCEALINDEEEDDDDDDDNDWDWDWDKQKVQENTINQSQNKSTSWTTEDDGQFSFLVSEIIHSSYYDNENIDYTKPCEFRISMRKEKVKDASTLLAAGSKVWTKQGRGVGNMKVWIHND